MDGVVFIVAATLWLVWVFASSRRVLSAMNSDSNAAWGLCMRWGLKAGLLFALVPVVSLVFSILAQDGRAADEPWIIFPILALASGPGFALYLFRQYRARQARLARQSSATPGA